MKIASTTTTATVADTTTAAATTTTTTTNNNNNTPWSRVLLEKLTSSQLVKVPALYGTRRFITTFTSACHLSLS